MAAQTGNAISLGYGPQGAQQAGSALLLAAIAPPSPVLRTNTGRVPWGTSAALHTPTRAAFVPTAATDKSNTARWPEGIRLDRGEAAPWGLATRRDDAAAAPWGGPMVRVQPEDRVPWGLATAMDDIAHAPWGGPMVQIQPEALAAWLLSAKVDEAAHAPWGGPMAQVQPEALSPWGKAVALDVLRWIPWTQYSRQLATGWGVVIPDPSTPDITETIFVPVRRVYIVINEASLRRVDGSIPLPTINMSLSLDVDSWAWSFSAALPGSALPNLEPATSGAPVEVEAMINGVAYRALVESIGRERTFGRNDIRVQGRGKTALLDAPFAPSQNFFNTGDRTAWQLMDDVLTVNSVPMGWVVDWLLEDWLVPAGVFSQQGSHINALNAIAAAAGGYIQPHASLDMIHVLPRYAAAPWDWASVTPDFDLPSDVTTREGIEWVERARYNRVFVSGQQAGVLGQVTRGGTAGDLLAPMVTDALITTAAAARQRGLSLLANTGRQANVTLRLPVLPLTGVITPGKFVQYTDASVVRRGIVRSTNIEVGLPDIWQTIGVETHE